MQIGSYRRSRKLTQRKRRYATGNGASNELRSSFARASNLRLFGRIVETIPT